MLNKRQHSMHCEICKRGVRDGIGLVRQNEKGVKGIWRCDACNGRSIDLGVRLIIDALNPKKDILHVN